MNIIAINVCDDGAARTIKAQYYKNSAANLTSKGGYGCIGVMVAYEIVENERNSSDKEVVQRLQP